MLAKHGLPHELAKTVGVDRRRPCWVHFEGTDKFELVDQLSNMVGLWRRRHGLQPCELSDPQLGLGYEQRVETPELFD